MNIASAFLFTVMGTMWTISPHWFCKGITPEQQARDSKRFQMFGIIILVLGLVLFGIEALKLK